jgi:hypothetical protein
MKQKLVSKKVDTKLVNQIKASLEDIKKIKSSFSKEVSKGLNDILKGRFKEV